jgi:hypothetical protein
MNTLVHSFPVAYTPDASAATATDPYASEAQTAALLRSGAAFRRERMNAADMLTTEEAAELADTSRVTINAWIKSQRCVGVSHLRRGFKLPRWQFEPTVFPLLQPLAKALGASDGWTVLSFLESAHPALDGLTPRMALDKGMSPQRILDIATAEGH